MNQILKSLGIFCTCVALWRQPLRAEAKPGHKFSFHLMSEPYAIDPILAQGTSGGYLYNNLFQGLYKFHSKQGLTPAGAKSCTQTKNKLVCKLDPQAKWSNGENITSTHYLNAFRRLIDPVSRSPQVEALLNIKNAKDILAEKKTPQDLGVSAPDPLTLVILFETSDPEFRYKLALPALAPLHSLPLPNNENAHLLVSNGPYKIKAWRKGRTLDLSPNPYYPNATNRPEVEIYFVDDDSTALNLYQSGRLTFLRRLVTDKIDNFKSRDDFYQVPMARFDYIGFGPRLKDQPTLRKALSSSLNYAELAQLYRALGPPGCPSLSPNLQEQLHCHIFKPAAAAAAVKSSPAELRKLSLAFSKMGGEDVLKGMEWMQNQWKKNLSLNVELKPQEQGFYLKQLQSNTFDLFRKGVGLDRPTCLAALEIFLPDHPENFIRLNDDEYNKTVTKLAQTTRSDEQKRLCSQGIRILIDKAYIIPMGEMHFTLLASPRFTGWDLNQLNQLDLTHLRWLK